MNHKVQLPHIVRRPRHDIPNALPIVKGLALAQQAGIQFVPRIPLDPRREDDHRQRSHQGKEPIRNRSDQYRETDRDDRPRVPARDNQLRAPAKQHPRRRKCNICRSETQQPDSEIELVLPAMRDDPANRAAAVVLPQAFN